MTIENEGLIKETPLATALSERYLAYALSTIMSRSLPDVRDGLKPVHRRLVFAMRQLKLDPKSGFKKCARIVGDVIGKYHPHGDASVYEALVRLAQTFAVRYPLVEGQGNFGSIDGDNAAAMRYTESRMTMIAQALLEGIDENAVDFRDTYDGEEEEPIVLPGAFPNLLANGASGIAVGMATNIPPHNAGELYAAAMHLIKKPDASTKDLLQFVQGPDFPTGGEIVEDQEIILNTYETGRGSLRLRARWEVEQGRFGTWQVVITEIPYQVQKSKLIEQIASLMEQKKLNLLADIRDESTDVVRLVLEPKNRTIEPEVLMESLFKATALEGRFSYNMNVLDSKAVPKVMGLKEILRAWLDHRYDVLVRRSQHRLSALERRLEILQGLLAVYLNLDEVIRIIREEDEVKTVLMQTFKLTDLQAESILNMRLRSLRRLEEDAIRHEYDELSAEKEALNALLNDESLCWKKISQELKEGNKQFGSGVLGQRRTLISGAPKAVDVVEVLEEVEREPLTIILSQKGWIKALKGHALDLTSQKFKEGDQFETSLECQSNDRICVFGSDGKSFNIKASDLPRGRGDGQPIRLLVELSNDATILALFVLDENGKYLLVSDSGRGFITEGNNLSTDRKIGKQLLNLKEDEKAIYCLPINGDYVAIANTASKFLIFPIEQIPELKKGAGVILQKLGKGKPKLVAIFSSEEGLVISDKSRKRSLEDLKDFVGNRAGVGKKSPNWLRG
ncbi:DNA gyrase/topoisomerase IV [Commensalibacter communis]|uniref:DNA topoisomerase 4 subunit A n=1 Tax=Commensalibacter communis TaxID=2972786 RepID=A0A9W4TMQ2_9PROT|nr:DNA topoisomerase IV subunit A [Commensalibacter communis]CAI3928643.1 DNA gyrase/topoisomerase IV [Commensalibacter communis]CAI3929221.1 DNA gyrase/topoisomerase IV [Commensalibacter communis]CAI3932231.1 DNA gyrase/topoisomerase IV [Commensalibacter communis]CAI3933773.1 DNA gyrase/topoisomerase IV [Commensalibacter communis]